MPVHAPMPVPKDEQPEALNRGDLIDRVPSIAHPQATDRDPSMNEPGVRVVDRDSAWLRQTKCQVIVVAVRIAGEELVKSSDRQKGRPPDRAIARAKGADLLKTFPVSIEGNRLLQERLSRRLWQR